MTAAVMFAGVDIGATGVKVGVVTSEGAVVAREQENYHPEKHEPQDVVDLAISVLHKVLETVLRCDFATQLGFGDLEAVGVGCPGVLEAGGVIHAAANFPSWLDAPLQQLFTDTLGRPVTVCNDADAAILAEQWVGTAKGGIKDFIMLTLGTGVGFGVVANGELVRGGSNAIEGGHMVRNVLLCVANSDLPSEKGCLIVSRLLSAMEGHAVAPKEAVWKLTARLVH
ncbi:hypothetical protein JG687_00011039 [Phytophthora cactorum]|uniref:ROK family n=1 Tax=Phytophthora cactorum TaxID=29920 RepID=A0A8T1UAP8_9STRA|nr:hypothetical protein JG687_00011039 [Phytophthora cactorum]